MGDRSSPTENPSDISSGPRSNFGVERRDGINNGDAVERAGEKGGSGVLAEANVRPSALAGKISESSLPERKPPETIKNKTKK